jgi:hypothetical protein
MAHGARQRKAEEKDGFGLEAILNCYAVVFD